MLRLQVVADELGRFLTRLTRLLCGKLLQVVIQGLSLLWLIDFSVAQPVLLAFLPLSRHSAPMRERLLVLLRKELYGTDARRRRLAVAGVCGLLRCGALCEEDEVDVLVALRPLLSADPAVADAVYAALHDIIAWQAHASTAQLRDRRAGSGSGACAGDSGDRAEGGGLGREAMVLIAQAVMGRFGRLVDAAACDGAPAAGKDGAQAAAAARKAAVDKARCGRALAGIVDAERRREDGGRGAAGAGARRAGAQTGWGGLVLGRCFEAVTVDGKTQASARALAGQTRVALLCRLPPSR